MFLLVFRNDVNTRPLQISVHINNTNNFNFYGQQPTENDGNQNILQGNMSQSSDEPGDDDDGDGDGDGGEEDDDDTEEDTDENSVDEMNGPNFPTPPNTIASNQDDNNDD